MHDLGAKWQVSTDGGTEPRWNADGREVYYVRSDRMLIAVPVTLTTEFAAGAPNALFELTMPALSTPYRSSYVPAANGQRFLVNAAVGRLRPPPITLVLDWPAALRQ